jgi:hypothetical protein
MPLAALAKFSFAGTVMTLFAAGRTDDAGAGLDRRRDRRRVRSGLVQPPQLTAR